MSTSVDNRVVQMTFDNKQFQEGIEDSLKSLQKFEASLDTRELEKHFDLSGISDSIKKITNLFDPLAGAAERAFIRITDSAVNAGIKMVKSLSIDNVTAGWEKYGKKTTSVGTLIAQGFEMDEVTDQLERLNWFTDETSYNFTEMVNNIGKFTASGKKLDDSVTAMEGIALWAALSGQNATTASHAMYQLSQAMSAGVMRRQDYMSIQTANMDTKEFRQHAIDAALAMKLLRKNADGTYTSIAEGVKKGHNAFTAEMGFVDELTNGAWFTDEVMMKVFNDYSKAVNQIKDFQDAYDLDNANQAITMMEKMGIEIDDFGLKAFKAGQEARTLEDVLDSVKDAVSTGFMTMFETLIGNYEQATALFTDMANYLYEVFATPINTLNEFLDEALNGDDGKRAEFIQTLANAGKALVEIWNLVTESIRNVWEFNWFLPVTVEQFRLLIDKIKGFTEKLVLTDNYIREKLEKTLTGFFAILHIGWSFIQRIGKYIIKGTKKIAPFVDIVLAFTAGVGDFFRILDNSISKIGFFNTFIAEGERVLIYARIALQNFKRMLGGTFAENPAAKKFYEDHKALFDGLYYTLVNLYPKLKTIFSEIVDGFIEFGTKLYEFASNFKMPTIDISSWQDFSIDVTGIWTSLKEYFKNDIAFNVSDWFPPLPPPPPGLEGYIEWVGNLKDGVVDKLVSISQKAEDFDFEDGVVDKLVSISQKAKDFDFEEGLNKFFNGLSNVIAIIIDDLKPGLEKLFKVYTAIMGILFIFQTYQLYKAIINFINQMSGLFGLSSILKGIGSTFKEFSKTLKSVRYKNLALAFLGFGAAITLISYSIYMLSVTLDKYPVANVIGAAIAVGVMMGVLYNVAKVMSDMPSEKLVGAASAFLGFAGAIYIIGLAIKQMTDFYIEYASYAEYIRVALITIGGLMLVLALTAGVISNLAPEFTKGAIGMIPMVAALWLLIKPLKELTAWIAEVGDINAGEGIAFLSALILALGGFGAVMNETNGGFWKSIGNVAVITTAVGAIIRIVNAFKKLTPAQLAGMKKAAIIIGGFVAAIAVALGALAKLDNGNNDVDTIEKAKTSNLSRAAAAIASAVLSVIAIGVTLLALSKFGDLTEMAGIAVMIGSLTAIFAFIVSKLGEIEGVENLTKPLLAMAVVLAGIGIVIGYLTYITAGREIAGLVSAITVVSTIAAIAGTLYALSGISKNKLLQATEALGIIMLVTIAIGFAYFEMKGIRWEEMLSYMFAMITTLGVIGLIFKMKTWSRTAGIKNATMGIGLIALASIAIGAAYSCMRGIAWYDMIGYCIAMATTLAAMAGALVAVTKFGNTAKAIEASGALAIMSVVFPVIAAAYKIMSTIDFTYWAQMAGMMLGTFATMALALGLLTNVAEFAPGAMLVAASAMVIMSAGLAIAGWGMKKFADAINTLMNTKMEELPKKLGQVAEASIQNAPKVAGALSKAVQLAALTLADSKLAYMLGVAGLKIIASFIEGVASGVGMVVAAAIHLALEMLKAFSDPVVIDEIITTISNFVRRWLIAIGTWMDNPLNIARTRIALTRFMRGLKKFASEVFLEPAKRIGGEIVDDIWDGVEAKKDEFYKKWYGFWGELLTGNPLLNETTKIGYEGVLGGIGAYRAGGNVVQGIAQGIGDNAKGATDAIARLAQKIEKVFNGEMRIESPSKVMAESGRYIVEGLAVGINKNSVKADKAMVNLAKGNEDAYCDYMGIHSASDVFIEKGKELINGLVVGVRDKSDLLDEALKFVGENNIKSLNDVYTKGLPWLQSKITEKLGLSNVLENASSQFDINQIFKNAETELKSKYGTSDIMDGIAIDADSLGVDNLTDYSLSLNDVNTQLYDTTSLSSDWMSQLEANGPILDKQTASIYAMSDATDALTESNGDMSKSIEDVTKTLHKIDKVDRVMLGAKALEYYEDYMKLRNAGILGGSQEDLKDYFTGKETATGIKGYWALIQGMQEEFAKDRADLFARGDIADIYNEEFNKYLRENMSRYQYDWTYLRGVTPTWTNDYVNDEGLVISPEQINQIAQGVSEYSDEYGGYGSDYGGQLSTIIMELDEMRKSVNDIYAKIGDAQVVLDTGVIAGVVAPATDLYIGAKQLLKARGV